jgi:hypothetical protein
MPNIDNFGVNYPNYGAWYDPKTGTALKHEFGARHNVQLYWTNISAFLNDPLHERYFGYNFSLVLGAQT